MLPLVMAFIVVTFSFDPESRFYGKQTLFAFQSAYPSSLIPLELFLDDDPPFHSLDCDLSDLCFALQGTDLFHFRVQNPEGSIYRISSNMQVRHVRDFCTTANGAFALTGNLENLELEVKSEIIEIRAQDGEVKNFPLPVFTGHEVKSIECDENHLYVVEYDGDHHVHVVVEEEGGNETENSDVVLIQCEFGHCVGQLETGEFVTWGEEGVNTFWSKEEGGENVQIWGKSNVCPKERLNHLKSTQSTTTGSSSSINQIEVISTILNRLEEGVAKQVKQQVCADDFCFVVFENGLIETFFTETSSFCQFFEEGEMMEKIDGMRIIGGALTQKGFALISEVDLLSKTQNNFVWTMVISFFAVAAGILCIMVVVLSIIIVVKVCRKRKNAEENMILELESIEDDKGLGKIEETLT